MEAGLAAHRRPGHPQLGQPRGRRAPGLAASTGCCRLAARVRRGRHLPAHRRAGPGPRRRVEDGGRPPHPRPRRRALRPRAERPHLRRADVPAVDRRRRPAPRRASPRSRPSGASRPRSPAAFTMLGVSNVSFGLKPAARHVLNSVFLHECVEAGLDSAIVHAAQDHAAEPDPRGAARGLPRPHLRPRATPTATTRCRQLLEVFADVQTHDRGQGGPLAAGRSSERLKHRIIDGDRDGLDRRSRRGARRRHRRRSPSSTTCCSTA